MQSLKFMYFCQFNIYSQKHYQILISFLLSLSFCLLCIHHSSFIHLESTECLDNPCLNGATCYNFTDGIECSCAPGYNGTNCELAISCTNDPCLNGATCLNSDNGGYECLCDFGWTGTNCETEIDECELMQCMNGASCIDFLAGFACLCPPGYTGILCETCRIQISPFSFYICALPFLFRFIIHSLFCSSLTLLKNFMSVKLHVKYMFDLLFFLKQEC